MVERTYFYPVLGGGRDMIGFRLGGAGLGNCLFSYFYTALLARGEGDLVRPAWKSFNFAPIMRGDHGTRNYSSFFRSLDGEVSGYRKLLLVADRGFKRRIMEINTRKVENLERGCLYLCHTQPLNFVGLQADRDWIVRRFRQITSGITRDDVLRGAFVGVHVRLGDFAELRNPASLDKSTTNTRLPLEWFVRVICRLREKGVTLPV